MLVVAVVVTAALAVKAAAQFFLAGRPPVELLGGAVKFLLVENSGAFLGLGGSLSEGSRRTIFVLVMGAALVGALAWLIAANRLSRLRTIALAMMIGGGVANWLDRIADGRVTDYVVLSAGPLRTGIFNLADAAILAGAVLWLLGRPRDGYAGVEDRKGGPG